MKPKPRPRAGSSFFHSSAAIVRWIDNTLSSPKTRDEGSSFGLGSAPGLRLGQYIKASVAATNPTRIGFTSSKSSSIGNRGSRNHTTLVLHTNHICG